jgi:hypothetical protein
MPWKFIDPRSIDPGLFGLSELHAVKVKKHDGQDDIRCFYLKGWNTFADLTDTDSGTIRQLNHSEWFVFAAKGRRETHVQP